MAEARCLTAWPLSRVPIEHEAKVLDIQPDDVVARILAAGGQQVSVLGVGDFAATAEAAVRALAPIASQPPTVDDSRELRGIADLRF